MATTTTPVWSVRNDTYEAVIPNQLDRDTCNSFIAGWIISIKTRNCSPYTFRPAIMCTINKFLGDSSCDATDIRGLYLTTPEIPICDGYQYYNIAWSYVEVTIEYMAENADVYLCGLKPKVIDECQTACHAVMVYEYHKDESFGAKNVWGNTLHHVVFSSDKMDGGPCYSFAVRVDKYEKGIRYMPIANQVNHEIIAEVATKNQLIYHLLLRMINVSEKMHDYCDVNAFDATNIHIPIKCFNLFRTISKSLVISMIAISAMIKFVYENDVSKTKDKKKSFKFWEVSNPIPKPLKNLRKTLSAIQGKIPQKNKKNVQLMKDIIGLLKKIKLIKKIDTNFVYELNEVEFIQVIELKWLYSVLIKTSYNSSVYEWVNSFTKKKAESIKKDNKLLSKRGGALPIYVRNIIFKRLGKIEEDNTKIMTSNRLCSAPLSNNGLMSFLLSLIFFVSILF
eukprot:354607_1